MSLLLDGVIEGQDLALKLGLAIEKSVTILSSSKTIEPVKKELHLLVELIKPTHFPHSSVSSPESGPTLLSTYSPKDFLRLQTLFLGSGHLKHLLRTIFDEVLIFWNLAFSEPERDDLIYVWAIHCPAIDTLYALNEGLTKLNSKVQKQENSNISLFPVQSTSISDSTIIEHAHQLELVLMTFLGFSESRQSPGLHKILSEISRTPSASQHLLIWNQLLSTVCNIPNKLFNVLKKETNPFFRPEAYFYHLTAQFSKSLTSLLLTVPFPFFSHWLAKMESLGWIEVSLKAFDPLELAFSDVGHFTEISRIFIQIPPPSLERLILGMLQNQKIASSPRLLEFLKGTLTDLFLASPTARFVLSEKVFSICALPWWVLRLILVFLHNIGPHPSLEEDWWLVMLEKMASTAGNSKFIKTESYERQRRLNRLLIYTFDKKYVSKVDIEASQLMMTLMATVQELLNQPSQKLVFLGMQLGEAFSRVLDPANPLNFDGAKLDPDDEPDEAPSTLSTVESLRNDTNNDFDIPVPNTGYLDPSEDYFAYLERQSAIYSAPSAQGRFKKGKFVEMNLNDDLNDVSEVKTPLYLRECLTSLRSDEPKVLEVVMRILAPLISSRPDDLPELAVTLASTLLHVVNNYELDNFDRQKLDAMTALTVYVPEKVIPFLTKEFYTPNYSSHERFVILDALCEASQRLSEHRVDVRPDFNPIALKVLNFEKKQETPKKDIEMVDNSVMSKATTSQSSRRWATERKTISTFKNRFAPFLEPSLRILQFKDHPKGWILLMNEPRLLGKLVYSISVFIDCAGVSNPDFEKTARQVTEIAWKVRYHEDAFVRRATLLTVASLIRNAPAWVLFEKITNEMNEIVAWLDQSGKDPDEEVRLLSSATLMQLSSIYKANPQYRPFDVSD